MHYDVLVIGAGPGGCMASRVLSDAGFRVLLVEKYMLPREKPCGGFLSPRALELIRDAFGPIPEDCWAVPREVKGALLMVEGGGDYPLPFEDTGGSVLRSRLDAFMSGKCGAQLMEGAEVTGFMVERFHVSTRIKLGKSEEVVESTYLIGADGADSMSLQQLRPEFHRLYASPNLERTMLALGGGEIDWDPQWMGIAMMRKGTGFARFFKKGDLIGLAVNHDGKRGWREELDTLVSFLGERVNLRLEGDTGRWVSASNRMGLKGKHNLGAGCALLVGEAAGLLDPWGLGIRLALESGRLAADSLVESAGESITPHLRFRYRVQDLLMELERERRGNSRRVGDLDVSSLVEGAGRAARKDRRALRRRFSR